MLLFILETLQQNASHELSDTIKRSCMKHHQMSHRTLWHIKKISRHRVASLLDSEKRFDVIWNCDRKEPEEELLSVSRTRYGSGCTHSGVVQ